MGNTLSKIELTPAQPDETFEQRYARVLGNYQTLLHQYQTARSSGAQEVRFQPEVEKVYEQDLLAITEMALGQSSLRPSEGFDPMAIHTVMASMMHLAGELNACGVSLVYPKREAPEPPTESKSYLHRLAERGKGLVSRLTGSLPSGAIEVLDDLAKYHWKEADTGFYRDIERGVEVDIPDFEIDGVGYSHNVELLVLTGEEKERLGCDTLLRVGCALDFMEGYMNHYDIKLRDGKFVSGRYGSEYAALLGGKGVFERFSTPQEFLQNLAENLFLPTSRFFAYFAHPSLSADMKNRVKELLEVKERYTPTSSPPRPEAPDLSQLFIEITHRLPKPKDEL